MSRWAFARIPIEGILRLAPKALCHARPGNAPGTRLPSDNQALKARVSSVCSFPIPYALVTLQTERALNLASRIEHAPHLNPLSASGARRNGAAYRVQTVEKLALLRACQARGARRHKLSQIERLLDFASPFPKGRG